MIVPAPWALRPDVWRCEFADDASLSDILARCLRGSVSPPHGDSKADGAGPEWTITEEKVWLVVAPVGRPRRDQGWKLHVSATVGSARTVLARVAPLLLARRCHFKFAKSLRQLELLNGLAAPEGTAGKFLTVYPDDDAAAVELAGLLDAATAGLDGPRILSDRPVRPGSLVHARYGAFRARLGFAPVGLVQPVVARPDGALEEDRRLGRFTPPPWTEDPFTEASSIASGAAARGGDRRDGHRIGDYLVEAALKRSNRGGTFRARSVTNGIEVVLKEARPHVATDRFGRDTRDRLRHEHAVLGLVNERAGHGIAPRPVELFDRAGHLYLAREYLPGTTLWTTVRRLYGSGASTLPEGKLRAIGRGLAALLQRLHQTGLVVRDFNPNNLLALNDTAAGDAPRFALVDLELAHDPAGVVPPFRGVTPAYASPQQEEDIVPVFADDVFSFGATLAFVATAGDPFFQPDAPGGRSLLDKVEERLALHRTPAWAAELILACLSPVPEDRPTAAGLVAALDEARPAGRLREPALPSDERLMTAVDGVVAYLGAARGAGQTVPIGTDAAAWLWPATAFGSAVDPRSLGHGSAGVGLFLLQRHRLGPTETTARLIDEVVAAVGREPAIEGERPPGLYYGLAGIAWFLAEAASGLGRPELARRGADILLALPPLAESPDVMTGTAGLGMAAIRLWLATGDPALLDRVETAARELAASAQDSPYGPVWWTPAAYAVDGVSKFYPGYAYGLAGIGSFLLAAAAVTGRTEHARLARTAFDGLLAWRRARNGRLGWPTSSHATAGSPCWLKGVAGIGAGLVRAYRLTGDVDLGEAAIECWRLLRPAPRHGPLTQLHGLAGLGEFFLDVADLLGQEEARDDARDVARTIFAARVDRRGDGLGVLFPDEEGLGGVDLLTGVAGIASFLLRLAGRTPRLVMLDDLRPGAAGSATANETMVPLAAAARMEDDVPIDVDPAGGACR